MNNRPIEEIEIGLFALISEGHETIINLEEVEAYQTKVRNWLRNILEAERREAHFATPNKAMGLRITVRDGDDIEEIRQITSLEEIRHLGSDYLLQILMNTLAELQEKSKILPSPHTNKE